MLFFSFLSMMITLISPCNRVVGNLEEVEVETDTRKLVWSDEFDKDGLPDESKWSYDVGTNYNTILIKEKRMQELKMGI